MQTQVKLNVNDELFDKAAEEILTAKITEMVRKTFNDQKIEKIIDRCNKDLSSVMESYFENRYGKYYPTDKLKNKLKSIFDSEIHKAITDIINKDNISEFVKNAVEEQVKEYVDRWIHTDKIHLLIHEAVRSALTDEIGKIAKQKFNEMYPE